ncbi:MAG: biotin/lipoyl-binding protein [Tissierellia bacterium]|nr:biotin/lipoyl-binding protein [Tissierellia bacterium]
MKRFNVRVNGKQYEVEVEELTQVHARPVVAQPAPTVQVQAPTPTPTAQPTPTPQSPPVTQQTPASNIESGGGEKVLSPMPGNIWKILVAVGDSVQSGETLLILEALKMENEIPAPKAGIVKKIHVQEGATVNSGDILVELE